MTPPPPQALPSPEGLPSPERVRWQPLRAGLVDIFYYDQEEFHFHGGSLLLRGNNGTGKSKVLALTLPFLLDGDLAPYRVEPDGDPNKRMEWNLLLGGRHPHPERLGYTWLEFGRRDADGRTHFLTIGAGLKAVSGRGIARHWFFVTSQRVGGDLQLLSPTGTAPARERLRDALGGAGTVYDRAVDYRRAVDEALFGLGNRYEALISLLIKLRQPQLSKRPDEKTLSRALSDALPPLDENLIAQVAEAFRSLDDERETLRELAETKRAADDFLARYRRYAQVATKRKAGVLRQRHSRYEQLGRDLAEAQRAYTEADERVRQAQARLGELDYEQQGLTARRQALAESPEARTAEHLHRLRDIAEQRALFARRQQERLQDIEADVARNRRSLDEAAGELRHAEKAETDAREVVAHSAERAMIADRHRDRVVAALATDPTGAPTSEQTGEPTSAQAGGPTGAQAGGPTGAQAGGPARAGHAGSGGVATATRAATELVEAWTSALRTLERLRETAGAAQGRADRARGDLDRLDGELAAADLRVADAETAATQQADLLVRLVREHLANLVELPVTDPDAVLARLEQWVSGLAGDNPAAREITRAATSATEAIARQDAALEAEQRRARARLDEIDAELRRLADGVHQPPPAPHTRVPEVRADRPGAPLWRVVDFAESVPDADRAGIEAALEAAGVLDAWLDPDGSLRDPVSGDTVLRPAGPVSGETELRPAGPVPANLDGLLRPAIDAADPAAATLTDRLVADVLAAIGYGAGSTAVTWVDADGRYGTGIVAGRWTKPAAEHIGDGARAAARRARVATLRHEADELSALVDDLAGQRAALDERRRGVTEEAEGLPSDQPVHEAHTLVRTAYDHRRETLARRDEARTELETAAGTAAAALTAATEFAADVGLPYAAEELAAVRDGLQAYQVALAAWWPAVTGAEAAARRHGAARRAYQERLVRLEPAAEEAASAQEQATTARIEFDTLDATAGASVAELQRQISEVTGALAGCEEARRHIREQEGAARDARGVASGRRDGLERELDEVSRSRDEAVEALRAFAGTGLIGLVCPDLELPDPGQPWAATPAVALARGVDRLLAEVDTEHARWERLQQQVSVDVKLLADNLSRHGHQVLPAVREETMIVEVVFQGHPRTVADLATALVGEIEERQRVLSAHEREVLETHLVNEVAGALQELISGAERQVESMNGELDSRPTSTGMRLRLLWRPTRDAPAGLAELRARQLRQSTDVWNEEDRRSVGTFLQQQIDRERLRDEAATWTEQLTRALDYRAWHEFAVQRRQDGQWRPATGPASGGERVLAASIPLFAAASSYYGSAGNPYAPRLIALDEAFAGVDDDSRAKCLGLLATFDLDVVMTSEREWGCYPQVPGLGIAQLARHEGIDAVLVTPWRWDGRERHRLPRTVAQPPRQRDPESGAPPTSAGPDGGANGLWEAG
ncbi:TIGR02680 family protein [Plantactinospora sp. KLBMP9567]|uniref:TIGR02680 family protein n=1 Tax=Plantactinospora sp. KLBMP9567 TaxID=3085900 RepID=UPI002982224D|nr:TIGR02680 family protein [Plantactinospora sp. KLBMP9567]MDW5330322.1 TIGR02680 family protein [Plantactinospora sp. KLBMP9567]